MRNAIIGIIAFCFSASLLSCGHTGPSLSSLPLNPMPISVLTLYGQYDWYSWADICYGINDSDYNIHTSGQIRQATESDLLLIPNDGDTTSVLEHYFVVEIRNEESYTAYYFDARDMLGIYSPTEAGEQVGWWIGAPAAIRDGRHYLIRNYDSGMIELTDVQGDTIIRWRNRTDMGTLPF